MIDSAELKIERASEHIVELNELFRESRPFTYILETNTKACERATYAKKNEAVIARAALICGDILFNLRSALDHGYWQIVSPHLHTDRERKAAQFPFSETAARLEESVKNRLADRVSDSFFKALIDLRPYGEPGGNELLYLIHNLNVIDKHKLLIPTGDYTRITADMIRHQAPDFPRQVSGSFAFGQNERDIVWGIDPAIAARLPPFDQILNVPVDIVFAVGESTNPRHMIPTLYQLVDVARATINVMREA